MGGSDNPSSSENNNETQLGRSDVMDILRKGSSALSGITDGMDLGKFLEADIGEILDFSREKEDVRDAKMKKELKDEGAINSTEVVEVDEKLLVDVEAEEQALLSGVAQVHSRLFEGKLVTQAKNNKQIASEWQDLQKRARVDRLVMVNGIAVIADHIAPVSCWKNLVVYSC